MTSSVQMVPSASVSTSPVAPRRRLNQSREQIGYLHYSIRTEQAYVHWVRAFIRFHGLRHPRTMGAAEVQAFLSWLSNARGVSVSTHRQALAALLFLYLPNLATTPAAAVEFATASATESETAAPGPPTGRLRAGAGHERPRR